MKITISGTIFDVPANLHTFAILKQVGIKEKVLAAKFNGELIDATKPLNEDGVLEIVTATSPEAFTILNHSCSHLMAHAISILFPGCHFGVGPAIKEGFYYDFKCDPPVREEDLVKIEAKMKELIKADLPIERIEVTKAEALRMFASDTYKVELINELEGVITIYKQGDFADLCRGPHLPRTGMIKNYKLLTIAGSYWRGDSSKDSLQRIYGVAFFTPEELTAHLALLEERKLRDHRRIGKELKLFMFSPLAGQGLPIILPNGMVIIQEIQKFILQLERKYRFQHVATPVMGSVSLYQTSGHWDHYRENMFPAIEMDNDTLVLRPMSCPHHILVYKNDLHSFRDLPLRIAETVIQHRYEASGALTGLERVRGMTLTDSHIFCTPNQIKEEFTHALKLILEVLRALNIEVSYFRLSLHDPKNSDKYFDNPDLWEKAESTLRHVLDENQIDYVEGIGEAAFYGPKLDIQIETALGHDITLSTLQLDFLLPERFDLTFVDEGGDKVRPVMIHRGLIGTYERFLSILIEQTKGIFPTWLAPLQVVVLPVSEQFSQRGQEIVDLLMDHEIRVEIDERNEKLGYRLRQAQINKVPYSIVIGEEEVNSGQVTYRRYGQSQQVTVGIDEFLELIKAEIASKKPRN